MAALATRTKRLQKFPEFLKDLIGDGEPGNGVTWLNHPRPEDFIDCWPISTESNMESSKNFIIEQHSSTLSKS